MRGLAAKSDTSASRTIFDAFSKRASRKPLPGCARDRSRASRISSSEITEAGFPRSRFAALEPGHHVPNSEPGVLAGPEVQEGIVTPTAVESGEGGGPRASLDRRVGRTREARQETRSREGVLEEPIGGYGDGDEADRDRLVHREILARGRQPFH